MLSALVLSWSAPTWSANLTESWYLSRGKSNLAIANYKAAIEAFEKVVAMDPDNLEARRGLGLAYDAQGLKDKAVEHFDKYLEQHPDDAEIALRQAEILSWSRYAYRRADSIKYYRAGLKHKDDVNVRLKFANLLATEKNTAPQAVEQYNLVLKRSPGNAAAFRGLAKAYAWLGDQDQALHYAQLARERGGADTSMSRLESHLMQGREPELRGKLAFIEQPGDGDFGLRGYVTGIDGKLDLTPFITMNIEADNEEYHHRDLRAHGSFYSLMGEYRPREDQKWRGQLGVYATQTKSADVAEISDSTVVGKLELETLGATQNLTYGFESTRQSDSFRSLMGERFQGVNYGRATLNSFYVNVAMERDESTVEYKPYIGWVSALAVGSNTVVGGDMRYSRRLSQQPTYTISFINDLHLAHYDKDQSGFTNSGAGYFSPQAYLNESPKLALRWNPKAEHELVLSLGPAVQFAKVGSTDGSWKGAADLTAVYLVRFNKDLYWRTAGAYTRVADVFTRFQAETILIYKF